MHALISLYWGIVPSSGVISCWRWRTQSAGGLEEAAVLSEVDVQQSFGRDVLEHAISACSSSRGMDMLDVCPQFNARCLGR